MVEKADLAEVSLVLRGAVPGAKVLAVRSAKVLCARLDDGRTVHMEDAVSLARRVVSGEISVGQGQRILDRLAGPVPRSKLDMEVDLALTRTGLLLKELEHRDG